MISAASKPLDCRPELGTAVTVERTGLMCSASPWKSTVGWSSSTTSSGPGLTVTHTSLEPAAMLARAPVARPVASLGPAGWVKTPPVPEAEISTVCPTTGLPLTSRRTTVRVEASTPSATRPSTGLAVTLESEGLRLAGSPWKVTVGWSRRTSWPGPGLTVTVTVLAPAAVLARKPVAVPFASVGRVGCWTEDPLPLAESCTNWPGTGLPWTSRTTTVTVEGVRPSATSPADGAALALEAEALRFAASATKPIAGWSASTSWPGPGFTVTVMVLVSAFVEAIVPLASPAASVVAAGWVRAFAEPLAASWTTWPCSGLPWTSRTTTLIVASWVPSATTPAAGLAVALETVALMAPGSGPKSTVGLATRVIEPVGASTVTETVLVSARVEARLPEATPPASVGAAGWVRRLSEPLAASSKGWSGTRLPLMSRTTAVITELSSPLARSPVAGLAVTLERAALTFPESPMKSATGWSASTTDPGPGLTVTVTVLLSALVELSVPLAWPASSVGSEGWEIRLFVPEDDSWTICPGSGLPCASRTVTVTVVIWKPSATISAVGLATAVDTDALRVETSAMNATVGWSSRTVADGPVPTVAVSSLVSARVEARVARATPAAVVGAPGWPSALASPLAASWTITPGTGFPFTSRTVTVTVAACRPLATTPVDGAATTVEREALTAPASPTNSTVGWTSRTRASEAGLTVTLTVLVSARVLASVATAVPAAPVGPTGWVIELLVPVAATSTAWPGTGLPWTSRTVTVSVDTSVPLAVTPDAGLAATEDRAALRLSGSPTKTTMGRSASTTAPGPGLTVTVSSLVSAWVEARVVMKTPLESVGAEGGVSTLSVPLAATVTSWPARGFPCASRTTTVSTLASTPSATTPAVGVALALESTASRLPGSATKFTAGLVKSTVCPGPGFTVMVKTLVSARVEARVAKATPASSVVPAGWVRRLSAPLAATATSCPGTGLPFESRTVTVRVASSIPSASTSPAGLTSAVDRAALREEGSATNSTSGRSASSSGDSPGLTRAPSTLSSATVEARLPTAVPAASVGPVGWVRKFPLPLVVSFTGWPGTGLPCTSRTTTVIVLTAEPSLSRPPVGCATTEESVLERLSASASRVTTRAGASTTAVGPGFTVTVIVRAPATVELRVPPATPSASVAPAGWTSTSAGSLEAIATSWPATGLPFASRTVTRSSVVWTPLATTPRGGSASAVERAASMVPGSPTNPICSRSGSSSSSGPGLMRTSTATVSARVEARAPVATPAASVGPGGWVRKLAPPPAVSCTVCPSTGLPKVSRTVTWIRALCTPSAITPPGGSATASESSGVIVVGSPTNSSSSSAAPSITPGPGLMTKPTDSSPARVEARVPTARPAASVGPAGWVSTNSSPTAESSGASPTSLTVSSTT